jgi:putative ABC transport system ATP-binding protein
MPLVEAVDLYRFFHADDDETLALRGVTLHVDSGEVVTISGPSGSGKSTLLHCLAGLDEPDGGTVTIAGERLTRRPDAARAHIRARHVGVLFQTDNLLEHLDVAGNVAFARRLAGRDARDMAVLGEVDIAHRARARPTTLSGGEVARAALAVALANDPALILADEPTGELDADNTGHVLAVLRMRADRGVAVVIVTHDPDVTRHADRQLVLADGRLTS